ncbi:putative DNA-directed RNA polymerases II 24 kDa polypeptide [Histomonas meleagridis]|uniref:putative DNA-directed RNA polymerases II 24 kDa polypeptide n=1 Tax=Histomonas meleagridis TaxID=135588 RepID=UPI00355A434D|nr:putative DNA-directed RNA polymerases II 24 kDa polypeptide [Histomonas meleagridis]KAH0804765.1 putative DNA-directed RNA polymerases II 24 kDa polypeptide [Histomonas meleagridis]
MALLQKDVEAFSIDIYRIRKTVIEMLADRGYDVGDMLEEDFDTFKMSNSIPLQDKQLDAFTINCTHNVNRDERVQARFDRLYISSRGIKEIVLKLESEKINHCIFVAEEVRLSAKNLEIISKLSKKIEFFTQQEMLINITHHNLVPKHEPLSQEEKEELLRCYHINENQLPMISKDDAICKYFGVERGTVMRITRRSNTSGRYVTYRLVI